MGGPLWQDREMAIILYYASRGVDHEGCLQILRSKSSDSQSRTAIGVKDKLSQLQSKYGLSDGDGRWDKAKVDQWLCVNGLMDTAILTVLSDRELDQIARVRTFALILVECH